MSDRDNIIKRVCKELGLTYKELGEKIGYSEGAIKTAASTGKISEPLKKAIELYLKKEELENELQEYHQLKQFLKKLIS